MSSNALLRLVVMLSTFSAYAGLSAQSQTRFNYQAQIRNAGNAVLPGAPIDVRLTIRMGGSTGDDVYREVHPYTTTDIGLVNLMVGAGTVEAGDIDAIAWGDTTYYLKVDVDFDDDGLFDDMGGAPIVSVPIAEYARNGGKPWRNNANGIHYNEGNVGIGTDAPTAPLEVVRFVSIVGDSLGATRIKLVAGTDVQDNQISSYDDVEDRKWVLNMLDRSEGNSLGFFSDAAQDYTLRLRSTGRAEFRADEYRKIALHAGPNQDNWITSYDAAGDEKWMINMYDESGSDHLFGIYSYDAAADGNPGYLLYLRPDGRTQVRCLEILGGCDINERFNSTETLEPGTVVIADPERPGQVCTTGRPYDQRVVGAISGANGIKPGITLTQEGTALDGTHPVALDGRVFVKVTGPVEVGDLLTTSNEPGRAMAVKNRKKAFGAVIGKALESDEDGDGLVLMLVQPR